ncbi:hypothetical protein ACGFSG_34240, partial [Streptomyces sp. NPDC048512]|uniref:hypothetical protein n=1 Tax=Streptomyces sp. NPDC048512 TaxID=3365563 RepID=UPI0037192600
RRAHIRQKTVNEATSEATNYPSTTPHKLKIKLRSAHCGEQGIPNTRGRGDGHIGAISSYAAIVLCFFHP